MFKLARWLAPAVIAWAALVGQALAGTAATPITWTALRACTVLTTFDDLTNEERHSLAGLIRNTTDPAAASCILLSEVPKMAIGPFFSYEDMVHLVRQIARDPALTHRYLAKLATRSRSIDIVGLVIEMDDMPELQRALIALIDPHGAFSLLYHLGQVRTQQALNPVDVALTSPNFSRFEDMLKAKVFQAEDISYRLHALELPVQVVSMAERQKIVDDLPLSDLTPYDARYLLRMAGAGRFLPTAAQQKALSAKAAQ